MRIEYLIGSSTGMNPRYLARLKTTIMEMSGALHRLEIRNA